MHLAHYSWEYKFPITMEPEWAGRVERWYQLDAPAYGLTEAYWRHRENLSIKPEWIFLASAGASNPTDAQFAQSPQASPAKFVHTLPNIRSAALLQVMNWSGPVLCVQAGARTLVSALAEALAVAGDKPVWVLGLTYQESVWTSHIFVLGGETGLKIGKSVPEDLANPALHDKDWLDQLKNRYP